MTQEKVFVQRIVESLGNLDVRANPMFGSYGLSCDEKFVAIIGNDSLYIKQSSADPALLEGTIPEPAYPGSKDYLRVPDDLLADIEWLETAIQVTADALPKPKPKKPKRK